VFRRGFYYFLRGLIILVPLMITVLVIVQVYNFLSGIFSFIGISSSGFLNTVVGFVITVLLISFFGYATGNLFFNKLFLLIEHKLEELPLIRHIYTPVKDFVQAFIGNKKKFNRPVLVKMEKDNEIYLMGFVTNQELQNLGIKDLISVYMPFSYSLAGRMILVPPDMIKPLEAEPGEVMKFIISGGVTEPTKEETHSNNNVTGSK